jgi:hypothetical protein
MARAMSGSGLWKPSAMRVRSRVLVLVDSTRALERPVEGGVDGGASTVRSAPYGTGTLVVAGALALLENALAGH